ncbi:polysaccharide biosynthesis C-terminal domain-containing protein [Hymenobacter sp. BT728]|uniref:lipopolysaccharide biosynthesis protein n=1 Tax=Hymenobacter pini TaxID=2880879 RepID=UPI001CF53E82|nr:polysaccharide biosynthesis C-terminal domain-containing protein [Hymenobacter pini]MCA8831888.1 polysaccharide biosynthesis C-terminal domain-containing protein [Hymenobacter pini]
MPKPGAPTRSTLLGTSAYLFLIRFFPTLASVAALVWLARHTPAAWYGRYQSFWVQWQVLHVVACLGLPTLVLTYPAATVAALGRQLRPKHWAALAGWAGLCAGGLVLAQYATGSVFAGWQSGAFLLLNVPVAVLEAYVLLGRQFRSAALVSIAYAGLFALSHVLLVANLLGSEQLMNLLLLGNGLRLLALARLAQRQFQHSQSPAELPAGRQNLWVHTALNEVVQILFRWVDKLAISFLLPATLFAFYFNGTIDVPFLPILLGAAGSALLLHFHEPEVSDSQRVELLKATARLLGRLVFPLFFLLVLFRGELFGVVFTHRYDAAVPLFLLSSLVIPLRAYNFTALLQHKGQGRIITTGAVLDLLVALVLMYPLYHWLGLRGVALAFVISTWLQAGYYLGHTARLLGQPWYQLLPLRAWTGQLAGFGVGIWALHKLLAQWLPEAGVLYVGTGCVGLLLAVQLWQARRAG